MCVSPDTYPCTLSSLSGERPPLPVLALPAPALLPAQVQGPCPCPTKGHRLRLREEGWGLLRILGPQQLPETFLRLESWVGLWGLAFSPKSSLVVTEDRPQPGDKAEGRCLVSSLSKVSPPATPNEGVLRSCKAPPLACVPHTPRGVRSCVHVSMCTPCVSSCAAAVGIGPPQCLLLSPTLACTAGRALVGDGEMVQAGSPQPPPWHCSPHPWHRCRASLTSHGVLRAWGLTLICSVGKAPMPTRVV